MQFPSPEDLASARAMLRRLIEPSKGEPDTLELLRGVQAFLARTK